MSHLLHDHGVEWKRTIRVFFAQQRTFRGKLANNKVHVSQFLFFGVILQYFFLKSFTLRNFKNVFVLVFLHAVA